MKANSSSQETLSSSQALGSFFLRVSAGGYIFVLSSGTCCPPGTHGGHCVDTGRGAATSVKPLAVLFVRKSNMSQLPSGILFPVIVGVLGGRMWSVDSPLSLSFSLFSQLLIQPENHVLSNKRR